jgi:hypothetical protein
MDGKYVASLAFDWYTCILDTRWLNARCLNMFSADHRVVVMNETLDGSLMLYIWASEIPCFVLRWDLCNATTLPWIVGSI